jgi:hypothetical protein
MKSTSDIDPRSPTLSRRSFVQGSVAVGGGALLGLLPVMATAAAGGLNAATRKATEPEPADLRQPAAKRRQREPVPRRDLVRT